MSGQPGTGPGITPGSEFVDIVDDDDRVIATVPRSTMRAERLQHRAVGIAVFGSDGRLLIHRRSEWKDVWPGWWDIAVGGVVAAGETYLDAAHRELAEEVGIDARALGIELVPVGDGRFVDESVALICHGFRIVCDGPFHFDDGEVVETCWVDPAELAAMLNDRPFLPDSMALLFPLLDFAP